MEYIIGGAYRAKKQFACTNAWQAVALQYHYSYDPVVEVGTKAILQTIFPDSCTPNQLTLYAMTPSGDDWALQFRMHRMMFDQHFEKLPLSIAINPAFAAQMKSSAMLPGAKAVRR